MQALFTLNENEISVEWSDTYEGIASIKVRGENDCGFGEFSEGFEVTIEDCTGIGENDDYTFLCIQIPQVMCL